MSTMKWLESLGFFGRGRVFRRWLAELSAPPRIAWYPAAGEDLRDLLYLTAAYARRHPAQLEGGVSEPALPDLFLHTDYFPWSETTFLSRFHPGGILWEDGRTTVRVLECETLERRDLPDDPRIVHFPRHPNFPAPWHFAMVEVTSRILGTYVRPLIYATAENNIFYHRVVSEWDLQFSHILRVGYGGGFGGGWDRGDWLEGTLKPRGAEVFIADKGLLPAAALQGRDLTPYRCVAPQGWGPRAEVYWYRVG